jgi:serine/threonine-protein kinase
LTEVRGPPERRGLRVLSASLTVVAILIAAIVMRRPWMERKRPTAQDEATANLAPATPEPETASAPPPPVASPSDAVAPVVLPATVESAPAPRAPQIVAPPRSGPRTLPTQQPSRPAKSPAVAPSAPSPSSEVAPGFLTLDTYPWTQVSEGGRMLGTTPLVGVPLSPGTHVLTLENSDQQIRRSYTVVIKSGETVARRLAYQ